MTENPWAKLTEEEALSRVRKTICPRWDAWTVQITASPGVQDRVTIWCARRRRDGALAHGDGPGRLLQHVAYADEELFYERLHWLGGADDPV